MWNQVSTAGGAEPLWSRDGRELFFQHGDRSMGVGVTLGAAFSASAPHVVHEGRFLRSHTGPTSHSITPDGSRFLRIQRVEPERAITRIDLVQNWFEELRRRWPRDEPVAGHPARPVREHRLQCIK